MDFSTIAVLHLVFTSAMVGLMSAVQLTIYPAFREVTEANFAGYIHAHGHKIQRPLVLFAPAEVILALLVWLSASSGAEKNVAFISGLLLVIGWVATAVWYGPFHGRLANEPYDPARIEQLINTNWARTVIWWIRGAVATWVVLQA